MNDGTAKLKEQIILILATVSSLSKLGFQRHAETVADAASELIIAKFPSITKENK